ncbi:C45 family autoproteolytic acyltransferase/hydolase [Virgibacillus sediminis]
MEEFKLIKVSGSANDRGKQLGRLAKQEIQHNIEAYKEIFKKNANIDWESAKKKAADYIPWIEAYDNEIMEEIRGISEGSGFDLLEITALNARSEIVLNSDGCTSIASIPETNEEKVTYLGQNWDWHGLVKKGVILLDIIQTPRPRILMATEAGIVGKIGMNEKGLGVCLNLLGTSQHVKEGVPIHVILRGILNSNNINQAIGQIGRLQRGVAANYLIAHAEGEVLNVESTPTDYDVLYPQDGYIAHANHFIGPRKVNINDTARILYPDTHLRQGVANKLLNKAEQINDKNLKSIFSNHIGYPDSICRHGEDYPTDLGRPQASDTAFSIIMNLTMRRFDITVGTPCEHPYKTYTFE